MSQPRIEDFIARLESSSVFVEVGDSMQLQYRLAGESVVAPAAYVVLASDEAQRKSLSLSSSHIATASVAVVFVLANFSQDQNAGDYGLTVAREAALTQLAGWTPTGQTMPVQWTGGAKLSAIDSNLIVWQDNYTIDYVM